MAGKREEGKEEKEETIRVTGQRKEGKEGTGRVSVNSKYKKGRN